MAKIKKKRDSEKSWKGLPSWIRGGLIGLILVIILELNFAFMMYGPQDYSSPIINAINYLELFITLTIGLPIIITDFFTCFKFCTPLQDIIIRIIWYAIYIFIGISIGYLVGRGKKSK